MYLAIQNSGTPQNFQGIKKTRSSKKLSWPELPREA
jgi:hypothetical protein